MRSKKVSIALDSLGSSEGGGLRTMLSQTIRGRVRAPKWLVPTAICGLVVLSLYHWHSLTIHGRNSSSFHARTRDVSLPEGESLDTRIDLLNQAAVTRAERMRSRQERRQTTRQDTGEDVQDSSSVDSDAGLEAAFPQSRAGKLTSAQLRTIDAAMDDMSETKRQLMHWLFRKYILPGTPEALEWTPRGHDPQDRPGYFRPGNWDWTMTKAGMYDPDLYSPPAGELPTQRLPQVRGQGLRSKAKQE
ncbi:hypothetical protein ElyMa_005622100 [Elysia marginata]|uniref:Uncharacterized protein n=1 Tax=Elysia marginata TaxID=1093978 RepID=A0AAV4F8F8_9GAST|nr:hypothetical protein ElyMa_005622100 [Elysia marginata]